MTSSRLPPPGDLSTRADWVAPPAGDPPSSAPSRQETADDRRKRIEWVKYYLATGQLQEASDIGWTGVDLQAATSLEQLVREPRTGAPSPPPPIVNEGDMDVEEQRRRGWIKYYVESNQLEQARALGWDGGAAGERRGVPSAGSPGPAASAAGPSGAEKQPLLQQDEEDDEEEEERRIAWIQHYVKAGELERAVELGWDGVDWRTNERLVEVLPPDEGGRGRPRPRSRASLLRVTSEQAEAEARAAPSPSGSAVHASSLTRI